MKIEIIEFLQFMKKALLIFVVIGIVLIIISINPLNFRSPRRDSAIVAFAGPASNFAAAIVFSLIFRLFPSEIFLFLVTINLVLGLFNLIPVPPLDGYKVLLGLLPREAALRVSAIENYGPVVLILFFFVFFRFVSPILLSILNTLLNLLVGTTL